MFALHYARDRSLDLARRVPLLLPTPVMPGAQHGLGHQAAELPPVPEGSRRWDAAHLLQGLRI